MFGCTDCRCPYGVDGWTESFVHHDDWAKLYPDATLDELEMGILCVPCIRIRVAKMELANMRMMWFVCSKEIINQTTIVESQGDVEFVNEIKDFEAEKGRTIIVVN